MVEKVDEEYRKQVLEEFGADVARLIRVISKMLVKHDMPTRYDAIFLVFEALLEDYPAERLEQMSDDLFIFSTLYLKKARGTPIEGSEQIREALFNISDSVHAGTKP